MKVIEFALSKENQEDIPIKVYPTWRSPAHQSCHNHPSIRPQARWIISNALHPFYFSTSHLLFKSPPSLQLSLNLSYHLLHRTAPRLHINLSIIATHSESDPANKPNNAKKCLWVQLAEIQMHKQCKIRTETKTPPLSKVVRSPFLAGSGL